MNPANAVEYANDFRWHLIQKRRYEVQIEKAVSFLRANGIEPILIKGWAAGLSYPEGEPRQFTDIDLAVSASDYERARLLLISGELTGINVDLHNELRHLDTLPWDDLFANSQLVDLDDRPIRILRPEDHLRLLCVHWLTDGGVNRDRLRDIYYAIKNRPVDFDWSRCLESVSSNRRRWVLCVIGLTNRYFDLPLDGLAFADEARQLPKWLIKRVEKEWQDPVHLLPLISFVHDPKQFFRQLKKRVPPSPIRATVEMEGDLDGSMRFYYQVGCFVKRLPSFFRAVTQNIRSRLKA
jgi:hypothetical protein